jgi:hypothetical protein
MIKSINYDERIKRGKTAVPSGCTYVEAAQVGLQFSSQNLEGS